MDNPSLGGRGSRRAVAPVARRLGRSLALPSHALSFTPPQTLLTIAPFSTRSRAPTMMDQAINKAAGLVEALSYIQRFHNKTVVVKVGGSIMDDEAALAAILTDIVFMNYVGIQPILVHGGGKAINHRMEQA